MKIQIFRFSPSEKAPANIPDLRKWWSHEVENNPEAKPLAVYQVDGDSVGGPPTFLTLAKSISKVCNTLQQSYRWFKSKL